MANEVEYDIWGKTWYSLLQNGSVSLYWRESVWRKYTEKLKSKGFDIHEFECSNWNSIEDFHIYVASILNFPDYLGRTLDGFNDCLSDIIPIGEGIVLAFKQYDLFADRFPKEAEQILDIVQINSWRLMLQGYKLIALVQSGNPRIKFDNIGTMPGIWNPDEWLNKSRGS